MNYGKSSKKLGRGIKEKILVCATCKTTVSALFRRKEFCRIGKASHWHQVREGWLCGRCVRGRLEVTIAFEDEPKFS